MVRRLAPSLALAALALASPGCLWARGTAEEPIVTELSLEGVKAFDPDDITEMLATRAPEGQLFPPKRIGYRLDPDALAADARRVEAWYVERGYYEAKVVDVKVAPDGEGRARVVMTVREGPPVRVRSIELGSLDSEAPEARKRLGKTPLQVGEIFNEVDYDATRDALLKALRGTGWPRAEVKQSARVLPEEGAVEVVYEVEPGPRLRFGPIFVSGTASVSKAIIKEQAGVAVHPGAWYDAAELEVAQARVFALGVFAGVRVTTGSPGADGTVPVIVAVREAPFQTIRLGPSVGLEPTRWELRGVAGWTHRNFFGSLRKVSVDGRAGYAWIPNAITANRAEPGDPKVREGTVGLVTFEYSQPAAFTRYIDASARFEIEKGIELGYTFWAERLQLGLPLRFSPRWTLVPSYNLEVYNLSNVPPDDASSDYPILASCPNTICLLSYLEQRIALDRRDSPVETRAGFYAAISVQEGINLGGYGYRYFRFLPEVRGFLSLGESSVLAARARIGGLIPIGEDGDPPIVARFFAGGPSSNRGFTTRGLGPKDDDGVPIGANGLVEGSVELRQGLLGALSGVLFVDVGQVAGQGSTPSAYKEVFDLSELELSVGFGFRYATPFGPVRFDVGLRPRLFGEVEDVGDTFTSFPGAVHVSIGEAF